MSVCEFTTRRQSGSGAQRPDGARPQSPGPRRAGRVGRRDGAPAADRGPHAPRHSQREVRRGPLPTFFNLTFSSNLFLWYQTMMV